MSTQFTNRQWRLPNNENKDKQSNYSMDFDSASSDYISGNINTPSTFTNLTVSCWVNVDSFSAIQNGILSSSTSSGQHDYENGFALEVRNDNKFRFKVSSGGSTTNWLVASDTSSTNQWYHIACVVTPTQLELFVNGVSKGTESNSSLTPSFERFFIGSRFYSSSPANYFDGQLDAVSIYNYALSSSQITTLYGSSSTGIGNPMSLSPKPVAYYPLGDQDAFNGSNYLVPNSSLKDYVFDFDGSNDYIQINNGSSLTNGFSELTVSIWANFSTAGTSQQQIISKDNTSQRSWILRKLSSGVNFLVSTDGTSSSQTLFYPSNSITIGKWYHFVGIYDGSKLLLYVNGVLIDNSVSLTGSLPSTTSGLFIGTYGFNNSYTFDGKLSNAQIFNTALPATGSNSVETLYNNGSPLTSMTGFSSLVSWWKLDASDTYDSSTGNWTIEDHAGSNDGTSSGMTQANLVQSDLSFTSGYSPYALDFDGTNDYIDCGTGSRFNINQITISAWVNLSSGLTSTQIIAGIRNNTSGGGSICYQLQNQSSGKFRFVIRQSNGTYVDSVANDVHQYNTWYHVLGVADGSNIKLYVNGNLQTIVSSYDGTIYSPNENFNIGKQSSPSNYYWDGKLSNVSVFNTGLTSAQVTELYNEGVPSNLNNHSAYSNLVSWWQLGSNSSFNTNWTILDEKGSNNGTSSNMGEDAIVDGVGSYANGTSSGMGGDEVIGDAPYSTANSLSVNMDVEDRVTDTPS